MRYRTLNCLVYSAYCKCAWVINLQIIYITVRIGFEVGNLVCNITRTFITFRLIYNTSVTFSLARVFIDKLIH